jgi:hypothetical protein
MHVHATFHQLLPIWARAPRITSVATIKGHFWGQLLAPWNFCSLHTHLHWHLEVVLLATLANGEHRLVLHRCHAGHAFSIDVRKIVSVCCWKLLADLQQHHCVFYGSCLALLCQRTLQCEAIHIAHKPATQIYNVQAAHL